MTDLSTDDLINLNFFWITELCRVMRKLHNY